MPTLQVLEYFNSVSCEFVETENNIFLHNFVHKNLSADSHRFVGDNFLGSGSLDQDPLVDLRVLAVAAMKAVGNQQELAGQSVPEFDRDHEARDGNIFSMELLDLIGKSGERPVGFHDPATC